MSLFLDRLQLSPAQYAAVVDPSEQVLVSAGAGSGKTSVLVAYFLHALVDRGVPAQDLVAVTFTRKAAGELTDRVRKALVDNGRKDLVPSLARSTIGTIHSLCSRLIREHAVEALVDPAFSIVEEDMTAMMKQETRDQIWNEAVEEAGDSALQILADFDLAPAVVPVYDRLRTIGHERPSISLPSTYDVRQAAAELRTAIDRALQEASAVPKPTKTLNDSICTLEECRDWLACGLPDPEAGEAGRPELAQMLQVSLDFFPTRHNDRKVESFAFVRQTLTWYRTCLAVMQAPSLEAVMNDLLRRFHDRYTSQKRERGVMDFSDLEVRALALVRAATDGGKRLLASGARVMVDEFQDTNRLQYQIIAGLKPAQLLMVGDERQSIYRFRGADVTLFRDTEEVLKGTYSYPADSTGTRRGFHPLTANYRSSRAVLDFVNRVFVHPEFFGPQLPGLDCVRSEDGHKPPPGATVDVVVVEAAEPEPGKSATGQAEARAVAAQVRRLIDEEGWRPSEIAILCPALTHAGDLEEAMSDAGVETYLVRGKGYYSREEVADVRALLQVLVNPHDDLALVTVLRSPMAGFSDDALYLLGRAAGGARSNISLWQAILEGAGHDMAPADRRLLDDLVQKTAVLRRRVGRPGLARLIDEAVAEFDYDLCALASPRGEARFANIRKLMHMAGQYESLQGPDLAGFVEVLETMDGLSDDEGNAPTLAENAEVVRIMTVHQAKGLEFPVVVLTGLGSGARSRPDGDDHSEDTRFVIAPDGRTAVFFKDTKNKTYEDYDLCWGPGADILAAEKLQKEQEDLRLLYVAMTRAEDRLILVGADSECKKFEKVRLGRILAALGSESLPALGETAPLKSLSASVSHIACPERVVASSSGRSDESIPGTPEQASTFLECGSPAVLPRSLSFSALAAYRTCPRRFYLERMLGLHVCATGGNADPTPSPPADEDDLEPLVEEPRPWLDDEEVNAGREVGILVHGLLERLPLADPCPDTESLRTLATEIVAGTTGSVSGKADESVLLSGPHADRTFALVRAFWDSPVASRIWLPSARKEVPFAFLQEDVLLSGVMDLLGTEGDSWSIVDYKTNALQGRSPAEVVAGYELQAHIYSLAALRAGAREVCMEFIFLEDPASPVTFRFSAADAGLLAAGLDESLAEMKRGEFPAMKGCACERCPLDAVCSGLQ